MDTAIHTSEIAHVIQLAVAPVFLLTGIGAMLSVLSVRLGRIVDRARVLEDRLPGADNTTRDAVHAALGTLSRRARMINRAITLCAMCALLICAVIVILFVGAFVDQDMTVVIAALFILCMLALIVSMLIFLKEIQLATESLRIGPH